MNKLEVNQFNLRPNVDVGTPSLFDINFDVQVIQRMDVIIYVRPDGTKLTLKQRRKEEQ